jgi:uncharacterized protein (TIGR02996 family)
MPTHDEFLQAILASPTDNGPRLIYADWLDEHGDPRGEFIRVQCTLEGLPCSRGQHTCRDLAAPLESTCEPCRKAEPLRRRAKELLERHRTSWTNLVLGVTTDAWSLDEPMLPYEYGIRALFRRGFVAEISCTAEQWVGGGRVRRVVVDRTRPTAEPARAPATPPDSPTTSVPWRRWRWCS